MNQEAEFRFKTRDLKELLAHNTYGGVRGKTRTRDAEIVIVIVVSRFTATLAKQPGREGKWQKVRWIGLRVFLTLSLLRSPRDAMTQVAIYAD